MKTEAEARKCWCPFARVVGEVNGNPSVAVAFNRIWDVNTQIMREDKGWSRCIASECMAWRWEGINAERQPYIRADDLHKYGYCGLAGVE